MTSWLVYIGLAIGAFVLWATGEALVSHILEKDKATDPLSRRASRQVMALVVCVIVAGLISWLLSSP